MNTSKYNGVTRTFYRSVYRRPILVSDGPSQTETPVSRYNGSAFDTAIDVRCHDLAPSK